MSAIPTLAYQRRHPSVGLPCKEIVGNSFAAAKVRNNSDIYKNKGDIFRNLSEIIGFYRENRRKSEGEDRNYGMTG